MHMEAVEYMGHWITVEADAKTGAWTYRIDSGALRKFEGSAAGKSEPLLFEEAVLLAKAEIECAAKPIVSDEA
jgi:hypothetical protein